MYLCFVITLLHPQSCYSNLLPDALFLFASLGYSVFYVGIGAGNRYDSLMFWTQHLHSFTVSSILFYYYHRQSTPFWELHKIVTVFIRTLFHLSCITQTIIAVSHYPAIFIVCRGVSIHNSAPESVSGYGCRLLRVAYFALHQHNGL
jgi:hypothetical protein